MDKFTVRWKEDNKISHKDFKSEVKAEEFIESLEKIPNVVAIYPLWE